jgi:NADH:ubiquinone oxidoreductase subunit 5 (subunit L)/multisubunit Na+/H+ antiporter MnhA subunit
VPIKIELTVDSLKMMFLGILFIITGSVVLFGSSYLSDDNKSSYFLLVLLLFVFSMAILIITPHFF